MNRSMMKWVLVAGLGLGGCAAEPAVNEDEDVFEDDGKYEAWNRANNPAYVDNSFVYEVDKLPLEGHTPSHPIAGDYWATQRDSINHRWDGETSQSPAEKFAQAFNKPGFDKVVTDNWGIYGHGRKACNETTECSDLDDGSSCVKPRGATGDKAGRCIPGWWGICHGWAPYAFSEKPPVKEVVHNGVTFYPGDITALGSLVYSENLPTKFLSSRCNKKGSSLGLDNTGRIRDEASECRDMNPGTFHIVASNFLGLRKVGWVEDRTYDDQVWNQPVYGFKVTNAEGGKLKEISKGEAISLLGLGLKYDTILGDTVLKKAENKSGVYDVTADGAYVVKLAGDGDVDLHVKLNAEATTSVYDCRPYVGGSAEECKVVAKKGDKIYYLLNGYAETSKVQLSMGSVAGSETYVYNTAAKRFFHVQTTLEWTSEGGPGRTLPDGASHIRTDSYEYILEADDAGRIQGGEWVGASRQSHPDFAWWPSGKPQGTLPGGLSYSLIQTLFEKAADSGPSVPSERTEQLFQGQVRYVSQYNTVGVPGGAKLTVTVTGEGNVELYVKLGRKPTVNSFDKKAVGDGANKTVELTAPAAGGTYYVRVRPIRGTSNVTVTAKISQ
jgi:hypothetical protein